MQGLALAMKDAEPVLARARAERRRFHRVRVDLPGRLFLPADGREDRCSLGLSFQGRAHNALDDARSMALSMEEMVKRGAVRPAA